MSENMNTNEEGKELEVLTTKIKALERLTVTGYQSFSNDTLNVVVYNNEYYCIDDPIPLQNIQNRDRKEGKADRADRADRKVKVRVIAEVKSEEELYNLYIQNNMRNTVNPFALLLFKKRHKYGHLITLPVVQTSIIDKIMAIPDEVLIALNEQLLKMEEDTEYSRLIRLDFSILLTIKELLDEGYTVEQILELIELGIIENDIELEYPSYLTLSRLAKQHEQAKKRKEERKEEVNEGAVEAVEAGTVGTVGTVGTGVGAEIEEREREGEGEAWSYPWTGTSWAGTGWTGEAKKEGEWKDKDKDKDKDQEQDQEQDKVTILFIAAIETSEVKKDVLMSELANLQKYMQQRLSRYGYVTFNVKVDSDTDTDNDADNNSEGEDEDDRTGISR